MYVLVYTQKEVFIPKPLRHFVMEYDCKNVLFKGKERKI